MLIFARMTGLFSMTPIFGARNVPAYVKAGLGLVMAYIMFPLLKQPEGGMPHNSFFAYIVLVISEFGVGLVFGYAASLIFSSIQMTGNLLDTQIGFGMVNIFDPQFGQQIPLVGNFKYILALLVFLATNSHHILLSAFFSTFTLIPVTQVAYHYNILASVMVDMVVGTFVIALKISLPVLVALLLTDVALGVLSRTMPQMNIFVVGVPGKIIVGIFVLSMALPFYIAFLEVVFNGMFRDIFRLLAGFQQ